MKLLKSVLLNPFTETNLFVYKENGQVDWIITVLIWIATGAMLLCALGQYNG